MCFVTLSLTINKTLKWLSLLPTLMQESFWWRQCSDMYIISLFPHLCNPPPPPPSPHPYKALWFLWMGSTTFTYLPTSWVLISWPSTSPEMSWHEISVKTKMASSLQRDTLFNGEWTSNVHQFWTYYQLKSSCAKDEKKRAIVSACMFCCCCLFVCLFFYGSVWFCCFCMHSSKVEW